MSFLTLEALSKSYGPTLALDRVSLDVAAGARTAIVGPSGSGKSTLLRLIAGFEAPDAGRITLEGVVMSDGLASVPAHRRGIGIVAQDGALFPHLSVADNIGFGLERALPDRRQRIEALIEMVELDRAMLTRRPHQLSGGQQQRVALARALACRPRLMLLDEPFSALDAGLRETMRRAVARVLTAAGIAAILVTHDQAEALSFADQVAVMRGGRLVQAGSPRDLYLHPVDGETARFLGDAIILPARIADGVADCALGRLESAGTREGDAEILLRPEQVTLIEEDGPDGIAGEIIDIEFGGAITTMRLRLLLSMSTELTLKVVSRRDYRRGETVRLKVSGPVHVFDGNIFGESESVSAFASTTITPAGTR